MGELAGVCRSIWVFDVDILLFRRRVELADCGLHDLFTRWQLFTRGAFSSSRSWEKVSWGEMWFLNHGDATIYDGHQKEQPWL